MLIALSLGTTVCSTSVETLPNGQWGSAEAILTTTDMGALLEIDAGGCIGSFGGIPERIPMGAFRQRGTYTQLMGVAPGSVTSLVEFSGTATEDRVSITIEVSPEQSLGPFVLTHGVGTPRERCAFP